MRGGTRGISDSGNSIDDVKDSSANQPSGLDGLDVGQSRDETQEASNESNQDGQHILSCVRSVVLVWIWLLLLDVYGPHVERKSIEGEDGTFHDGDHERKAPLVSFANVCGLLGPLEELFDLFAFSTERGYYFDGIESL